MKEYISLVRQAGALIIELGQLGVKFRWKECADICRELESIFDDLAAYKPDLYVNVATKEEPK